MRDAIIVFFIVSLRSTPVFAAKIDEPAHILSQGSEGLSLSFLALFLVGCLMVAVVSGAKSRTRGSRRSFLHYRIRELEAKIRILQGDTEKSRNEIERLEKQLNEANIGLVRRDNAINEQQSKIKRIQSDLMYSIIKTRELRADLAEKAIEIVHAEAKIREVETGLWAVHPSTDKSSSTRERFR